MTTHTINRVTIYEGDCLQSLRAMPGESVHCVVTDPPYGLSFMGKRWDYDVPAVEVWQECLRVLKPGGHLLAFAGTRTQHRMAVRIEDAGFEIRDMIAWVYGSGFSKGFNLKRAGTCKCGGQQAGEPAGVQQSLRALDEGALCGRGQCPQCGKLKAEFDGWSSNLKPALEPITVARKPLCGTVAANVLAHGTGAINVDGCRISALTGQRPCATLTETRGEPSWAQEKNLCDSCARLAESHAKQGTQATRGSFVGSRAVPTTSERVESNRADTDRADTGCFAGPFPAEPETDRIADSSLSTGASGRMPTGRSQRATKSTTSTATDSTTGLRTCNACGCSTTDPCTSGNTPASKSGTPNTPAAQGNAAPVGRWPSNLIHDGSDEVTGLFPVTTSGKPCGKRNAQHHWNSDERGTDLTGYGDTGSAARFFYCAKADSSERRNSKHPTVKPLALMRYLCRLVCPPDGIVLDPFCGSGTTLEAARLEGFQAIGCELNPEYIQDCKERLKQGVLF